MQLADLDSLKSAKTRRWLRLRVPGPSRRAAASHLSGRTRRLPTPLAVQSKAQADTGQSLQQRLCADAVDDSSSNLLNLKVPVPVRARRCCRRHTHVDATQRLGRSLESSHAAQKKVQPRFQRQAGRNPVAGVQFPRVACERS